MADALQTGTLSVGGDNPFPTRPPASTADILPANPQQALTDLTKIQQQKTTTDDALLGQWNAREEQNRQRQEKMIAAEGATIDEIKHGSWNAQEEMAKRETGLWEQFGSPAFLVAMMGSAFSAMPMNSALNAGGAAIASLNKGKMDDYQRAFDAWKVNTDLVLKRAEMEHREYEDIDHLRRTDMESWRAKATAIATRFDDQRKLALLHNGMESDFLHSVDALNTARGTMAKVSDELTERNNKIQWIDAQHPKNIIEWQKLSNQYDEQKAEAKRGLGTGTVVNQETRRQIQEYDNDPINAKDTPAERAAAHDKIIAKVAAANAQGRSVRSPKMMALMKKIEENPNMTSADMTHFDAVYTEAVRRASTLGVRSANVDAAVVEAEKAAKFALQKSNEVPRGDYVPLNKLQQLVARGTSSPAQKRLDDATASMITAYAQTMSRSGANTVYAQERATELLLSADGPEAYKAGIETLLTEMSFVQSAIQDVEAGRTESSGSAAVTNDPLGIR